MAYLILVGMMGSGKSTVGKALSEALDVPFLDTDAMLEYRLGRPVGQLFELYGEEAFRHHETAVLQAIEPDDAVLSTGGGIVLKPENWVEFRRLGSTVYLDASPEILIERLEKSNRKRPLLQHEHWHDTLRKIVETRKPLYEQADLIVPVGDQPISEVVDRIIECLRQPSP